MPTRATKTGRNDPCPCGSGSKYKQCCQRRDDAQNVKTPAASLITHSLAPRPVATKPSSSAYYNAGVDLHAQGNLDAAAENYLEALALNPDDARAHGNLGVLLQSQGKLDAAIESYRRAIALSPTDAGALSNLAVALETQGDVDAAIQNYRRSIALNASEPWTHNNLGNALRSREYLDEAVEHLRKAIALKPDYAEAHNNLGNALQDQGKLDAAIASFQTALALKPEYLEARWNESLALLMQGRLEEGWARHEWRLEQREHLAGYRGLLTSRPMYAGEDLAGKTILIWAEQGLGDEIFFAGVLPDVIRAAGHCIIECDPRLVSLYARSFPAAQIIPKSDPPHPRTREPDIDWQCPIGSLPRFFRPEIRSFPEHHGYLAPDAGRVAFWKQRCAALGPAPRIGITWRSKHRSAGRDLHYTDLRQWGPIFRVPGLTFINLQYDECRAELDAARLEFGVEIHDWEDLDQMNDLDEVAALMKALDLVIAPTTTPGIMAGAVGAPAWMLLTRHITWKTLGTEVFPMFPDLRPIWRPRNVSWDTTLDSVALKLREEAARR